MSNWYSNYTPSTTDDFNKEIITQLETNIKSVMNPRKNRTTTGTLKRWYNSDEAVKRINKQYKKVKKKWEVNPTRQNLTIYKRMAQQVQDVKNKSREKYWTTFLQSMDHTTSLKDISNKIRIIQGERAKGSLHPNPTQKSNELREEWAQSSSYDCLPIRVRRALAKNLKQRLKKIKKAFNQKHPSDDKPITKVEFHRAVKIGKSTSPGMDGITYDIIRFLSSISGNPVLKLYNMIWSGGNLPKMWKRAIMVPVPKPGKPGSYRLISLTSCLCKVFERIILNRLLYTVKHKFSKNMYGYMPGKSTQHCIHRVLSGIRRRFTDFVDTKGAFDRANPIAILAELSSITHGNVVRIVQDYLADRCSRIYFEGVYSKWEKVELGTPQGGILSPTLFNILMNVIGSLNIKGVLTTIYADDIVLQADSYRAITTALKELERACNSLGLVISPEKTKVLHKRGKNRKILKLQGKIIEEVATYKYMGVVIGQCNHRNDEVAKLQKICQPRLALLKKVAWGSVGSSIPVLRMLYISMIRSVIDYSASNLIGLSRNRARALETIQNNAIRIILGCPRTAKIETIRHEVNLPPITDRIKVTATLQIMRSLNTTDDGVWNEAVFKPKGKQRCNKWLNSVRDLLDIINVKDYLDNKQYIASELPPWEYPNINISFSAHNVRKCDVPGSMLQQDFYKRFDSLSHNTVLYTDGSLQQNGRAGAGVALFQDGIMQESSSLSIRASDNCSTTTTELLGIAAALSVVKKGYGNVTIVSDSLSALQTIVSNSTKNVKLSNRIRKLVYSYEKQNRCVNFIWAPSHCGIKGNDKADELAKQRCQKERVDYEFPLSLERLKTKIEKQKAFGYSEYINNMILESTTLRNYMRVTNGSEPNYVSRGLNTRRQQTSYSRLRLGYRYLWEVSSNRNKMVNNCKLCNCQEGHRLHHYIKECTVTAQFRSNHEQSTFYETLLHFLNVDVFLNIKKMYPRFANSV